MSSLGNFASLQAVWEAYPEGANKGDYIFIPDTDGVRYNWDKYKRAWVAEGQPSSGTRFTEHVPGNIEVDFDAKINGSLEVRNFDEGNVAEKAVVSAIEERVFLEEGKTIILQEEVAILQEKTIRNKGIFATLAELPTTNLVAGDFAYVGTDLAALELYNYTTSWVDSGTTFNVLSLDLVDSVTGDAVDKAPTQHAVNAALPAQTFAAVVLANPFTAHKSPRRIGDFAINTASGEIWQATAITNAAASWNCISAGYYNGRIITNWDTHTQSGDITSYDTATGAPTSTESFYGHHINSNAGTANAVQWAIGYTTNKIYIRTKTTSTWGAWSTGITAAELGYLSGVTSNIQDELNVVKADISGLSTNLERAEADIRADFAAADLEEAITRAAADYQLGFRIDDEQQNRSIGDNYLQSNINNLSESLGLKFDKTSVKNATGTSTTDVMSQKKVTDELNVVKADISGLSTNLERAEADIRADFAAADLEEAITRAAADYQLGFRIDDEQQNRSIGDNYLQSNINSEAVARAAADTALQNAITAEAVARAAADTGETFAREAADTALHTRINGLSTDLERAEADIRADFAAADLEEAITRAAADYQLGFRIDDEQQNRSIGNDYINSRINNLSESLDLKFDKTSVVYLNENEYQVLIDNDLVLPGVQYNIYEE